MIKSEQIEVSAEVFALLQGESPAGGAPFEANGEGEPPPPTGPEDYGLPPEVEARLEPNGHFGPGAAATSMPKFTPIAIDDVEPSAEPAWAIHRLLPARAAWRTPTARRRAAKAS